MALLVAQPIPDPEPEVEADLRVPPAKVAYNLRSRKNGPKGEGEREDPPSEKGTIIKYCTVYICKTG